MVRAYVNEVITLWEKNPVFLILPYLDTIWTLTRLVMHVGGRCLDLRVMSCLCCKWLEWCRRNHAWPFKIACGQWLSLGWVLCAFRPRSWARHVAEIRVKPRCFLLPCQTSLSVCQSSQHFNMIWLHARSTAGRSSCGWCFIHISDAEACQACLMLMLDVSYFFFCLPLPTQPAVLLNDLTFCLTVKLRSIFVSKNWHLSLRNPERILFTWHTYKVHKY